jgi:hypothetical protein
MKKNQWILTCSIQPKQFSHFINNDAFECIDGSQHSKEHCGLKLISDEYANWFNQYKIWELYEKTQDFIKYENEVEKLCELNNIKFEGI